MIDNIPHITDKKIPAALLRSSPSGHGHDGRVAVGGRIRARTSPRQVVGCALEHSATGPSKIECRQTYVFTHPPFHLKY